MKRLFIVFISLFLVLYCPISFEAKSEIVIEKIDFNNKDFIKGMDISSLISLENSGVKYYNQDGAEEDLLRILALNGVNYIRVRVWNNPFDKDGNGYGGGNCDINTAVKIAERAKKYNLKMLIDFHYSDFWADPAKQKAPKAWENLSTDEKAEKVKEFTDSSLRAVKDTGVQIGMVQIGNETTGGIAGVYDKSGMAKIFNAGSSAVRKLDSEIKVAIHFTNPEKTEAIKVLADFLNDYNVDYDVFATSYYPYWHGSLENLTDVLNYAATKYSKEVIVAETSYANTLKDTDSHPNTVSQYANNTGENLLWDFTLQGQANEVRAVMDAVNKVENKKGLGVFYWEGAWISVGDITNLSAQEYANRQNENKMLWEQFGSGWASSYSSEYDPDDAGKYFGGSAVDNQAFFTADGKALSSLKVFDLVTYGNMDYLLGDAENDGTVDILDVSFIQRHLAYKTDINKKAADTDGDNAVTIKDATAIQKYLAKIKTEYPIGGSFSI